MKVISTMKQLWHDESGQAITEYGAILAFVSILILAIVGSVIYVGGDGTITRTPLGNAIWWCFYWLGFQMNKLSSAAS